MDMILDQLIQRLENLPPFNIYAVNDDTVTPWFQCSGPQIVRELVIHSANLTDQAAAVSAQIASWGRLVAQAQRVWQIEERHYKVWQARKRIAYLTPDPADKDWKKPTEAHCEALYRTDAEYPRYNIAVERAQEAYNSAVAIQEGFKAKAKMLAQRYEARGAA